MGRLSGKLAFLPLRRSSGLFETRLFPFLFPWVPTKIVQIPKSLVKISVEFYQRQIFNINI